MNDIVFLHPPAFPDFRENPKDFGPISDVIPSYPIFDTFPLGFVSLLVYLEKNGFKTRIVNLAARMIMSKNFDAVKKIKAIKAKIYAIDLHWLVHLNGALYLAYLIKKIHEAPVLLGGLSSTYFWHHLIRLPHVDYIIRGDTTEEPLREFLEKHIEGKENFENIPNLVWKQGGKIKENAFSYVPDKVLPIDYSIFVRVAAREGWMDHLPFANFITAPITGIFTVKGCTMNCAACGGSNFSFKKFFNRKKLALKEPKDIIFEMNSLRERIRTSIFFVGDLQQTGKAEEILRLIREEDIDDILVFEFFKVPSRELLEQYRKTSPQVYLQISPESHDDEIRIPYGRPYTNAQLIKFLKNSIQLNFDRIDLYFMAGLPKQDFESVINTAKFASKLISKKINAFLAPLAPFVDPGSLIYEFPERFGYRILFRSLLGYSKALNQKVWYKMLNYETKWMDRETIALATYIASKILIDEKIKKGLLTEEIGEELKHKITLREKSIMNGVSNTELTRIICDIGELYPSRSFFTALKMRAYIDAIIGVVHKFV